MQVDLTGQVAIVTGGAQGIGRAIVEHLTNNGAKVAIVDLAVAAAQATVAELTAAGKQVAMYAADVADAVAMSATVAQIVDRFGRVDILINNAGINTVKDRVPIHEYSSDDWERILRVDLTGVFVVSQAVIPRILAAGGGRIVNLSLIHI